MNDPKRGIEQGNSAISDTVAALHPLDIAPIGRGHRAFIIIIGLAAFFDFFDLMLGGVVSAALLQNGWSTLQLNASFLATTGIGGVISNLSCGFLADQFGRRAVFRAALLLVGIFTLLASCSPSMPWLIGMRFVSSLGMAAIPALGWTLIVEILPAHARGRWSGFAGFMGQLAILACALVAYIVIPGGGWRWMFVFPGLGCTALFFAARWLPESPRWLDSIGRTADADKAMRTMGVTIARPPSPYRAAKMGPIAASSSALLFRAPLRRRLILAIILAVGGNIAMTAFLSWLPTILLGRGFTITHSLGFNLIVSAGSPVGAFTGAFIADRIGRKRGLVAIALLALALAAAFSVASGALLLSAGFLLLVSIGLLLSIIMGLYLPELFPTGLRARGTAIAMASVRLATVVLPFALLSLLHTYGTAGVMGLIGACMLVIAIAIPILGHETGSRPLDLPDV